MIEQWRPVVGYEGKYEVSDLGRVRLTVATLHSQPGRIITERVRPNGYCLVTLVRDGKLASERVHRLVAHAFLGAPPEGCEVNHRNGDKSDNGPANLEYIPHAENMAHAGHNRLMRWGEGHSSSCLTTEQARAIRALVGKQTRAATARQFGVSEDAVYSIQTGRTWKHLDQSLSCGMT